MKEDADIKARRRRSTRESFPPPLNQIALRQVDAVQSLGGVQKAILADVVAQVGMSHITACLAVLQNSGNSIKAETDLIAALHQSTIPDETNLQDKNLDSSGDHAH